MRRIRALFAQEAESERRGIPAEELLGARAPQRSRSAEEQSAYTRRELLLAAGALASGAALARTPERSEAARTATPGGPRVAIVGAGLAGLSCAHMLWTHRPRRPVAATVYDANPERAGGRCWTLRGFFADSLQTEHGGAFIDSKHMAIRRLAARLGLREEVVNGGDLASGEDIYWIDGAYYTHAQATADWRQVGYRAFRTAARELRSPAGERRLDEMSVPEWLERTEIGASSRLGKLLLANAVTENGGDPDDQSALDLIEITAPSPRSTLELLPGDDERYHIRGGNDQIVAGLVSRLAPGALRHGHELVALRENADQTITLGFHAHGGTIDVVADLVVLALPFSTLRRVDLSRSSLSPTKQSVIRGLGMGTNAKLHLELRRKTWPRLGFAGATYSEWDRYCCAWDDSVPLGPSASPALLLGFPGGRVGRTGLSGGAHGAAPHADVRWFLKEIEPVYPGTTAAFTGRAYEDHWAADPWVMGAYSYNRVGQASTYGPLAAATEGRIHFAGEHTSPQDQGFLEGAVATGERAARQILGRI
jgi:monoamine oxidase